MLEKLDKAISLLCKLQNKLLIAPLVTIYKSLIRPHLDYGGILYDQIFSNSFHEMLESIQYNAVLKERIKINNLSVKNLIKKYALNPYHNKDGTGNFVSFSKSLNLSSTSLN